MLEARADFGTPQRLRRCGWPYISSARLATSPRSARLGCSARPVGLSRFYSARLAQVGPVEGIDIWSTLIQISDRNDQITQITSNYWSWHHSQQFDIHIAYIATLITFRSLIGDQYWSRSVIGVIRSLNHLKLLILTSLRAIWHPYCLYAHFDHFPITNR